MAKRIVFILLIFLGCSSEEKSNITLVFWAMGVEGEYVSTLIKEFERKNPEIKVVIQQIPWTAAQEKLITAYASNMLPDIFQLGNTWIPQFKSLLALENLDGYIKSSSVINSNNYFRGIWETNIIDSSVYGIPWYVDTRVLFYRSDILRKAGFNEPPKTWNELYTISKKVKKVLDANYKYPIYISINDWSPYIIFGMQNRASILKNNNCYGNFSSPEFKEAFDYLLRYHREKLSPIGISQVTNIYQAFHDEYIAMFFSGPWSIKEIKRWMVDSLSNCWSIAPMPAKGDKYPGLSLAGGSSLVINRKSNYKSAAWRLIEFLSLKDSQIKFYELVNDLPAVKNAWLSSPLDKDKFVHVFFRQFENVKSTPKIPEWEQIVFSKLPQYVEYVVRGKMNVSDALKYLDKDVNKILEKRRWLLKNNDN